jgi:hypothetical protein
MMNPAELIPQHKHDFERLEKLLHLDPALVEPHLNELLHWIEDINWPVARPIIEYLLKCGDTVVPHVVAALNGSDFTWKTNILVCLVSRWPEELVSSIQGQLFDMARGASVDGEWIDIEALAVLANHRLGDIEGLKRLQQHKLDAARIMVDQLLEIGNTLQ